MNAPAPSLFKNAPVGSSALASDHAPNNLVDLLYDGIYMIFLLKNSKAPTDAASFTAQVQQFLTEFERNAKKAGFNPDDVFDAKYAFCATVDEAILSSRLSIRDVWERRPLQLTLFGDQLAGEHFFDELDAARNGGAHRLHALEVFQMCLLLGFKGRYLLEGPEKLGYLTAQLGQQIAHIKGRCGAVRTALGGPDRVSHTLKRELPAWVLASVFALFGLVAYIAVERHASGTTQDALAPYHDIVQLAPQVPTLTITLP